MINPALAAKPAVPEEHPVSVQLENEGRVALRWLATDSAVQAALADLATQPCIAIDTEFVRENTYFPQPGLVQLRAATGPIYLLDPLSINCQRHLSPLLTDPRITKVLHAASEDLQVLHRMTGVVPANVYDCQIAAAFANLGEGLGLHRLLEVLFDISLPKDETRSDWRARPLSQRQLRYAALDVAYLAQVYQTLNARLHGSHKAAWNAAENKRLATAPEPAQCYRRIKGHERLSTVAQGRLQRLAGWRETTARELDIPKTRIVRDGPLTEIARQPTVTKNTLRQAGLHPQSIRKFAEPLIDIHQRSSQELGQDPDNRNGHEQAAGHSAARPLSRKLASAKLPVLQSIVADKAAALELPASLLASRRELEALLSYFQALQDGNKDPELPQSLCGWRQEVIGDDLLELLKIPT
ncbi:MAG: hypothetical protein GKR94_22025 [Gammaproteobacteria bacterium]|nr:hypothetical protein [Gammaproteobacteria bacterium]